MAIPWKAWGGKVWDWALIVVRNVAPDKGQADPPPEPSAEELWDRWKGTGRS